MAQVFEKFLEEFSLFHRIIARSICMLSVRRAFLQSIYIGKEWNSMVFLNFLPEVIPGHYDFGMNRQEILREIYLWYSKRAVFSRFWDIWLLSKKPLRRRVCNTQLALTKKTSRVLGMPLRDSIFPLRNFLVRQFEWGLLYPSKMRLPWSNWWYEPVIMIWGIFC